MANGRPDYSPKADQPRVTTGQLKRTEAPASIQYRVTGIKTFNPRQSRKEGRMTNR